MLAISAACKLTTQDLGTFSSILQCPAGATRSHVPFQNQRHPNGGYNPVLILIWATAGADPIRGPEL